MFHRRSRSKSWLARSDRLKSLRRRILRLEPLEERFLLAAMPTLLSLSSPATALVGQPLQFTASVTVPGSPSAAPSGGTVTFRDGSAELGTAPLINGQASLTNSVFVVGAHSLTASYGGDGSAWAGSTSAGASLQVSGSSNETSSFAMPCYEGIPRGGITPADGVSPAATSSPTGMTPTQIRQAYGTSSVMFGSTAGDGTGTTIAIVDAYDDPNIASDLASFDTAFGLPAPASFTKVNETGGTTYPAANSGWITEIALDVEWAHAVAPGASILLVEANSNSDSDLFTAVNYARNAAGVVAVSMSWSGGEFSGETADDGTFTTPSGHAGVTFLAASGDDGAPPGYPAISPNVVAVGGTTLALSGNNYGNESGWSGSGGGISSYEAQPSYQSGVVTQNTTMRTNPDVSYDANPSTGFPVYDSYNNGSTTPWGQWGGTSDACPQWAALVAIADQGRALAGKSSLDGATQTLPILYELPQSDFHDITAGSSAGTPSYSCGPGYDLVTGRGTPQANSLISDLVSETLTSTTLSTSAGTVTYGQSVTLTATAAANPSSAGTPNGGTVTFLDYGTAIGSAPLTNGTATFTTSTLNYGTHALTASYSGYGTEFLSSSSSAVVLPAGTISTVTGSGTYNGNGIPATAALLGTVNNVVTDAAGDIFIADNTNDRVREVNATTGLIATVAGNGTPGYSGDGGPATAAKISDPQGLAVDGKGNLYFSDYSNDRVREVNLSTGIITTVAGNGTAGYSGDGGAATAAKLYLPTALAVDGSGNLYIADYDNNRIREVNAATGIITTVVGNGTGGYNGDAIKPTAAEISHPDGLAVDAAGDIFIADDGNQRVREVSASNGLISTIAGTGTAGYNGDGQAATAASLWAPGALTVDAAGDVFIADFTNERVREVYAANGTIATVAGTGTAGYSGDGGRATAAMLYEPEGAALDAHGNLLIGDYANSRVRSVNLATGIITTAAGGFVGDNGPASAAAVEAPCAVAVDAAGDVFIADTADNRVREINAVTGIITTVAGNGNGAFSGDGGPATAAALKSPEGVLVDSAGDVFIADWGNNRVREVNALTGVITTVAGTGSASYGGDGGPATAAALHGPMGLALDNQGDLFIADNYNYRVREVNLATSVITTVVGNGTSGYTGDGGQATAAELKGPTGVAVDAAGNLYIADRSGNCIREVNQGTGVISTIAGNGTAGYGGDGGPATAAELKSPDQITLDSSGNLYIADYGNYRLRKLALGSGVITTVGGNGTSGFSGDGGPATAAELSTPTAVAVDGSGDVFIADYTNDRIREVTSTTTLSSPGVTVNPASPSSTAVTLTSASTAYGGAATISATLLCGNVPVSGQVITFSLRGTTLGSALTNASGVATLAAASMAGYAPANYSGYLSSSFGGTPFFSSCSGTANLTISPAPLTVAASAAQKVYGAPDPAFSVTYAGFVAGDGPGNLGGALVLTNSEPTSGYARAGNYAITPAGLTSGNYAITFVPANLMVTPDTTRIAVSASATSLAAGQLETLTATVTAATPSAATPTGGNITFTDNGNVLGTAPLTAGTATFTTYWAVSGNHSISATYGGDGANFYATGTVTTVVGNGAYGLAGDGGQATAAEITNPWAVAEDAAGNLYIADFENQRVRKVNAVTGVITTVAGDGLQGYNGDGGQATQAALNNPMALAVDNKGDLFIADSENCRVREVNLATGVITTVAGDGTFGDTGDGGLATAAELRAPEGLALDNQGHLFVCDAYSDCVRLVNLATGIISTMAGNGTQGYAGNGGPATAAEFFDPQQIALDAQGDLFIADDYNYCIREVNGTTGIITTVAGTGTAGWGATGGQATATAMNGPGAVAVDAAGNLYLTDNDNNRVCEVNLSSGVISTVAGIVGLPKYGGDGGPATAAYFNNPWSLTVDTAGDLYIADFGSNRIRLVTLPAPAVEVYVSGSTAGTTLSMPSPETASYGGNLALSATLLSGNTPLAGDTITFSLHGNTVGSGVTNANGVATLGNISLAGYNAGNYASYLTAGFAGGGNYAAANATGNLTITADATVTALSASSLSIAAGQPDTLTATVTAPTPGTVTPTGGNVIFYANGNALGSAVLGGGTANLVTSSLPAGTDVITATYAGDGLDFLGGNSASNITVVVGGNGVANTTISLTYPTTVPYGGNLILSATLLSGNAPLANDTIIFSLHGNSVGSAVTNANGVATLGNISLAGYNAGNYASYLTASFAGGGNYAAANAAANLTITADATATALSATSLSINAGQAETLTATVVALSPSMATPTGGNVTFYANGNVVGSAALSGGTASLVTTALPGGNDVITAAYAGDGLDFLGSVNSANITTLAGNTAAYLNGPSSVAVDSAGDVFIADENNNCIREINHSTGLMTVVAGTGAAGYGGDGGPATAALLHAPASVALDAAGNIYVAELFNERIREINAATGIITTVAGTGISGYSGDGGPATAAKVSFPESLAIDSAGDIYFADFYNQRVRMVNAVTGNITTVAGNGTAGYNGDGQPATAASLNYPEGVALDSSGNLYIADAWDFRIRKVNTAGIISTVAGKGAFGYSGDGGQATAAQIGYPDSVLVDASGDLYFTDSTNHVRMVNAAGIITTYAGNGVAGYGGDGGPATAATLDNPGGLARDSSGNVYIADYQNNAVRRVNAGGAISTVFGGTIGDGGAATAAALDLPTNVAVDAAGDVFIADTGDQRIREINHATGLITTIAGNGNPGYSGDGGQATAAELNSPLGLAVDAAGNVYVADGSNDRIRKINTATGVISTVAGNGVAGFAGDGGPATAAELYYPMAVTLDAAGDVFIADADNERIREVNAATGKISTVAGTGSSGYNGDGQPATAAELNYPTGVAVDGAGNVYISDAYNYRIRKVSAAGNISTIAGNGVSGYTGDGGPASAARIGMATAILADAAGDVYYSDSSFSRVREINAAGVIWTVAGNGTAGYSGDGNLATAANLNYPEGLAVSASGNLYISDYSNKRIRETFNALVVTVGSTANTTLSLTSPATAPYGGNTALSATLMSGNTPLAGDTITFTLHGNSVGSAVTNANGVATLGNISLTGYNAGNYASYLTASFVGGGNCAAANATGNLTITADATVTALSASSLSIAAGQSDTLTATVTAPTPGTVTPTGGNVTFYANGNSLGSTPLTGGTANLVTSSLPTGTDVITATYAGDGLDFLGSTTANQPVINTAAGNGSGAYGGDNGPATAASLNKPNNVAVDAAGDVFIADTNNNRVREVNAVTGAITTVAGTGTQGFSGDRGPATAAELNAPTAVALDAAGNLYIADGSNNRIREVNLATGNITTLAGNGANGFTGDGGPATAAELFLPAGLAVDAAGDVFIADENNNRIREVNAATGVISTVAGNAGQGYNGDNQQGTAAELYLPQAVALDAAGNLYIGDTFNDRIRKLNLASGVITTIAGNGTAGDTGNGGAATAAEIGWPEGLAVDAAGNLYFADRNLQVVRKITAATGVITAFAGIAESQGSSGDGGAPTAATLFDPQGVAVDRTGDVFIADTYNNRVREVVSPLAVTVSNGIANTTLTIPSPETVTYGGTLTLSGTLLAGNTPLANDTISFSLQGNSVGTAVTNANGVATLGNISLAGYAAGNYASYVGESFAGNANDTASSATGNLVVNKAALTVTANSTSKTYGQTVNLGNAAFTSSGLVSGDAISNVTLYSVAAGNGAAAGNYPITAGNAIGTGLSNYNIAYANGTLTVNKALLTVTAANAARVYDAPDPAYTANYTGFVNGDTAANAVTGSPSLSSSDTAASPAGYYTITAGLGTLAAQNYSFALANGALAVTAASTAAGNLSASATSITLGQSDALAVTVTALAPSAATPTGGNVTFYANGNSVGSVPLSGGTASLATSALPLGNDAITATYGGDGLDFLGSSCSGVTVQVNGAAATSLNMSPATATYGSTLTLSATLLAGNTPLANDTISFSLHGNSVGTAVTNANGVAALGNISLAGYAAGNYASYIGETFAGNGNDAAASATGNLVVNKAALTVTANSTSKTYGQTLILGNTAFTSSGLVGNDSIGNITLTSAGAANTAGVSGSPYAITPGNANGSGLSNYNITYANGSLTVNKAPLTVTAANAARVYGAADPAYTATYSGFVNGDTVATALTGAPSLTSTDTTASPAGNYAVMASQGTLAAPNYSFALANGTLTVAAASTALALSESSASIALGQSFTLTANVTALAPCMLTPGSGNVAFYDGGALLGNGTISGGTATLSTTSLAVGTHWFTAHYAGDGLDYLGSTGNLGAGSTISTVAGNGAAIFSGDGGPATAAGLHNPADVVMDAAGNVFIADKYSFRVREINAVTGNISTIAGDGSDGFSGNGGQATAAAIGYSSGLALDSSGDLYIADSLNGVVREVNLSTGIITTVAGTGSTGFGGDGGPATAARLNAPSGVAVDAAGDVFIADQDNNRVREVNHSTGTITTVAGGGTAGDGDPATAAGLSLPVNIALDAAGNLYVADAFDGRVREVNAVTQIITTVAGTGSLSSSGGSGMATAMAIGGPVGVAVDASGDLFIVDELQSYVFEVNSASGVLTTVAGTGAQGYSGDGGPASAAALYGPSGIALDSAGDLLIADQSNQRVREITAAAPALNVVSAFATSLTVAASGSVTYGGAASLTATLLSGGTGLANVSVSFSLGGTTVGTAQTNAAGVATLSGLSLGGLGAGTYSGYLGAVFAGNASYVASSATATLVVNKAALTITAYSASKTYGQTLALGNAAFTSSGLVGSDSIGSVSLTSAGAANTAGVSGSPYAIVPGNAIGAGLSNYNITYANGSLTVNKAPLTVTAANAARVYGAADPAYTATYSGFVNGDTVATALTGAPSLTSTDTTASPAGNYAITASQGTLAAPNYSFALANGTLTVAAASTALALSESSASIALGQSFTLTANVTALAPCTLTPGSGNVAFYDGGALLGNGTISGGTATLSTTSLAVGTHWFTAHYAGDGLDYLGSTGNLGAGSTISTVAGNGAAIFSGDGGPATAAGLYYPAGVVMDAAGNLYIADQNNDRVREINAVTGNISTIAGNGSPADAGDGGQATAAAIGHPAGVALDSSGILYIADFQNNVVRKVNLSTDVITTVAGTGSAGFGGDGGPATAAQLDYPAGLAVDAAGDVFIADQLNNCIREVNASTGMITTVAGGGTAGDGGQATAASLYWPGGVALDAAGNLYVADDFDGRVREVNAVTHIITTVAGDGSLSSSGGAGMATAMAIGAPAGVAVDASGDLFIVDQLHSYVFEVNSASGLLTTVAGTGKAAYSGDGGLASAAALNGPCGLALDSAGDLFVADQSNNRVREITAAAPAVNVVPLLATSLTVAAPASATYGGTLTLSATLLAGSAPVANETITFTLHGSSVGTAVTNVNGVATLGHVSLAGYAAGNYASYLGESFAGAGNYAAASATGNLVVNKASLTITADSSGKTYGQTLTLDNTAFASSGLVNGDSIGGVTLTSAGTANTAAVGGSPYTIVPGNAAGTGLSNYNITYANGSLTVAPAALTITANSASKTYGKTLTFGSGSTAFSASGLQNGETIGSLTITAGGGAAANASAGNYTLTPSAATGGTFNASNYNITYANGTLTDYSSVAGRDLFYANSTYNGNSDTASSADDNAIDTSKTALLPGQTATYANYTDSTQGINGIMVDINGLANPGGLTAADFQFLAGNDSTPGDWTAVTAPTVTVRSGAGTGGSARVELIWSDNTIHNEWLQVTVRADANTGLAANDVFYFGSEPGAVTGNGYASFDDIFAAYRAIGNAANLSAATAFDVNHDGMVTFDDIFAVYRAIGGAQLNMITAPAAPADSPAVTPAADATLSSVTDATAAITTAAAPTAPAAPDTTTAAATPAADPTVSAATNTAAPVASAAATPMTNATVAVTSTEEASATTPMDAGAPAVQPVGNGLVVDAAVASPSITPVTAMPLAGPATASVDAQAAPTAPALVAPSLATATATVTTAPLVAATPVVQTALAGPPVFAAMAPVAAPVVTAPTPPSVDTAAVPTTVPVAAIQPLPVTAQPLKVVKDHQPPLVSVSAAAVLTASAVDAVAEEMAWSAPGLASQPFLPFDLALTGTQHGSWTEWSPDIWDDLGEG